MDKTKDTDGSESDTTMSQNEQWGPRPRQPQKQVFQLQTLGPGLLFHFDEHPDEEACLKQNLHPGTIIALYELSNNPGFKSEESLDGLK